MDALLELGADTFLPDVLGNTALDHATLNRQWRIIPKLLSQSSKGDIQKHVKPDLIQELIQNNMVSGKILLCWVTEKNQQTIPELMGTWLFCSRFA